jgi:hypothetical protein
MTLKLTDEMRRVLEEHPDQPLRVEDEHSHACYVVIPAELYDRLAGLMGIETELDPEVAIGAVAEAFFTPECWDAPGMELYDDYDAHRDSA